MFTICFVFELFLQLMGFEMKRVLLLGLLFHFSGAFAQDLSGQWRGTFNSAGNIVAGEGNTEYVLELEVKGNSITGYSYTYFDFPGRRCYVLCRLEGNYEPSSKSMVVTETEKIKSNTPPNFVDCLQTHILTFFKQGNIEKLVGRWQPARKIDNCGTGSTELERKLLTRIAPPKSSAPLVNANPKPKNPAPATKSTKPPVTRKSGAPIAKNIRPVQKGTIVKPKVDAPKTVQTSPKPLSVAKDSVRVLSPELPKMTEKTVIKGYENRSKQLLRTIEVSPEEFRVDLYDNGEIDGDSISVFFNGKLLVSHQRLSDKAISLKVRIDPSRTDNDLVMYAENLGSIPPNTALMVVTVGDQRYEVRITSTEQTSGTVRFKLKE
jgi:hypothetical protein